MKELRFVLEGEPASKKNSQNIVYAGDKPLIVQNKRYKAYEKAMLAQIPKEARLLINEPVNVCATYYRSTRRTVDRTNLENALLDVLVRAGVLMDDNRDIVAGTDGSRVLLDNRHPRTEVVITPFEDESYTQWRTK